MIDLENLIDELGITATGLAKLLKVHRYTIQTWRKGVRSPNGEHLDILHALQHIAQHRWSVNPPKEYRVWRCAQGSCTGLMFAISLYPPILYRCYRCGRTTTTWGQ